jgi:hypothetical protein
MTKGAFDRLQAPHNFFSKMNRESIKTGQFCNNSYK